MFGPKKTKYRKSHRLRGKEKGMATKGYQISFGSYALKSLEGAEISARQIEAARRAMTRHVKRGGKIWIRVFPHKPITQKAAEVPMGSGKGALDHYVSVIRKGAIIFEMDGVNPDIAKEAMTLAAHKLPVKCRFINIDEF
ncbi:50S ribosomal protein L16 [Candidatus Peregrinibacteria bacterium]|nr:50S ribosomal protein L16 [Candidatus Peregrinibacteria bacterium]